MLWQPLRGWTSTVDDKLAALAALSGGTALELDYDDRTEVIATPVLPLLG